MRYLFLFVFLWCQIIFAQEASVELNPPKPVVGESFSLSFRIQTTGNEQPNISFTPPSSVEVLGKSNEGVSISSVIVGGRVTVQREVLVVYELRAKNVMMYRIKDIKVEINGAVKKLPDLTFNVLREREKPRELFYEAIPSKTKVYLGEGFDIAYYAFSKYDSVQHEATDYPKLLHFIKRFHDVKGQREIVNLGGETYSRLLLYHARLYPQKIGKLTIDSYRAVARFQTMMGFGQISVRERNMYSPPVQIEVLPLPTANVPKDFTGLVGEHDFKLAINKEKFLANEVIEAKLVVQGPGALESFEGPKIFQDTKLEDFEVKSDLQELNQNTAKKVFDYTYLTRSGGQIPSQKLSLSYFDPISATYKAKTINVPAILISGVATSANQTASPINQENAPLPKPELSQVNPQKVGIMAPVFTEKEASEKFFFKNNWINIFNTILAFGLIIFASYLFIRRDKKIGQNTLALAMSSEIKNKGLNYVRLHQLVNLLRGHKNEEDDVTLNKILDDSSLSLDAKNYFKELVNICEQMGYNADGKKAEYQYEKSYFKELVKAVDKRKIV